MWVTKLLIYPVKKRIFWLVVVARGLYLARHLFTLWYWRSGGPVKKTTLYISVVSNHPQESNLNIYEVSKRFFPQSRKTSGKNGVQWAELPKVAVLECFVFCYFFATSSTPFSKSKPQISNVDGNSSIFIWFLLLYMRGRRVQLKNINAKPQGLLCLL